MPTRIRVAPFSGAGVQVAETGQVGVIVHDDRRVGVGGGYLNGKTNGGRKRFRTACGRRGNAFLLTDHRYVGQGCNVADGQSRIGGFFFDYEGVFTFGFYAFQAVLRRRRFLSRIRPAIIS